MSKEHFSYAGSRQIVQNLDQAARRAGVSRGQAFEDWLTCAVCALSGQQMEEEYLATVHKGYDKGEHGKRGVDSLTQGFGRLVVLMEQTRADILGDVFQGAITHGEAGQFFTPDAVTQLMAKMSLGVGESPRGGYKKSVCDPCCGSGRLLLAAADQNCNWEFIGQDIDLRCVRMTAINLSLRNLYGYVMWGDSLANEVKLAYRTGLNVHGGVIRFAKPDEISERFGSIESASSSISVGDTTVAGPSNKGAAQRQLHLF